jgi:hypothetical protein
MATYRPNGRHSTDKAQEPTLTTGYSVYLQDEEKAYLPAVVTEYDSEHFERSPETANDLVTEVIHAVDDPTLNPVFDPIYHDFRLSVFTNEKIVDLPNVVSG